MDDSPLAVASAVAAVGRIDAVPTLLQVLCDTTGMRFAVVARVTDTTWTACAVKDDIDLGVLPGCQLAAGMMLCFESRAARAPIVIEHASADPRYQTHPLLNPRRLRAMSPCPSCSPTAAILGIYARSIRARPRWRSRASSRCSSGSRPSSRRSSTINRRKSRSTARCSMSAPGELREQFIAILGHDLRNPLQAIFAVGDMLERKVTDPALSTLASRIKTNARRMSALLDDVLDFARGRLGGGIGVELADVADINTGLMTVVQAPRRPAGLQNHCRHRGDEPGSLRFGTAAAGRVQSIGERLDSRAGGQPRQDQRESRCG